MNFWQLNCQPRSCEYIELPRAILVLFKHSVHVRRSKWLFFVYALFNIVSHCCSTWCDDLSSIFFQINFKWWRECLWNVPTILNCWSPQILHLGKFDNSHQMKFRKYLKGKSSIISYRNTGVCESICQKSKEPAKLTTQPWSVGWVNVPARNRHSHRGHRWCSQWAYLSPQCAKSCCLSTGRRQEPFKT